jgi:hypothetical protein
LNLLSRLRFGVRYDMLSIVFFLLLFGSLLFSLILDVRREDVGHSGIDAKVEEPEGSESGGKPSPASKITIERRQCCCSGIGCGRARGSETVKCQKES